MTTKVSDKVTYELTFDFEYFADLKQKEPSSVFKKGEKFYHNSEFGVYYAVADGAQISDGVAAKMGRQMKQKMFVKSDIQMF